MILQHAKFGLHGEQKWLDWVEVDVEVGRALFELILLVDPVTVALRAP
jgi:hypothetical protein